VCSGTSSGPSRVSVCEGLAVVRADPAADPGSGLRASPAHRGTGRLLEGVLGCLLWKPRWLARARQEHALSCLHGKAGEPCCGWLQRRGTAPARVGGALGPTQGYLPSCAGFSKQLTGFPNRSPHPAGDVPPPPQLQAPQPAGPHRGKTRAVPRTERGTCDQ